MGTESPEPDGPGHRCLAENTLVAFASARLSEDEARGVLGHVEACLNCRQLVAEFKRAMSATSAVPWRGGQRIGGRYIVGELLGRGGMGLVYAAHDPELDRPVALKVLRADVDSTELAGLEARLRREAQAMARLSHPNVVPVFDVGVDGRSLYVAMERVEGTSLRAWLLERPRAVREILEVFAQAGTGLLAAHRAGLVHRDFKPDNVLVGADGRVRVTDFGLARTVGEESDSPALPSPCPAPTGPLVTTPGTRLGTPAYMSPEQHAGRPADASSDQFSFCVALYEALCGARPFARPERWELRPSAARALPRWLRPTVVRGLSADPASRWPSLEPLLARLDFRARRRRTGLTAALVAGLGLALTGGWLSTREARPSCEGGADLVAEVWSGERRKAVRDSFMRAAPSAAGPTFAALDAQLQARSASWAAAHRAACAATWTEGRQSEELLDLRMGCLEVRRRELSGVIQLFARADARVVERAVGLLKALSPLEECSDVEALRSAALGLSKTARDRLDALRADLSPVRALVLAGKFAQADDALQGVLTRADSPEAAPVLADARLFEASIADRLGARGRVRAALEAAVAAGLAGRNDRTAAGAAVALADHHAHHGAPARAAEWERMARALIVRLGGAPALEATLEHGRASQAYAAARYREAAARFERAAALDDRSNPGFDRRRVSNNVASALNSSGQYASALALHRRILEEQEASLGPEHAQVSETLLGLSLDLLGLGRFDEALATTERALGLVHKNLGEKSSERAYHLFARGEALFNLGRHAEALRDYASALELWSEVTGAQSLETAVGLFAAGRARARLGRRGEATALLARALEGFERAYGAAHPELVPPLVTLGAIWLDRDQLERALPLLERARGLLEGAELPAGTVSYARFVLARARWAAGPRPTRATALADARRAREELRREPGFVLELREVERWLAARPEA